MALKQESIKKNLTAHVLQKVKKRWLYQSLLGLRCILHIKGCSQHFYSERRRVRVSLGILAQEKGWSSYWWMLETRNGGTSISPGSQLQISEMSENTKLKTWGGPGGGLGPSSHGPVPACWWDGAVVASSSLCGWKKQFSPPQHMLTGSCLPTYGSTWTSSLPQHFPGRNTNFRCCNSTFQREAVL